MPSLADVSRRGALPAIAGLSRSHPEPLGAMGFARASGVDPATASRIRDELQRAGVIEIVTGREQGAIREQQIRLTPLGREIGHHVVAIQEALDRAERRAQRGR